MFEILATTSSLGLRKATRLDAVADLASSGEGVVELVKSGVKLLNPLADLAASAEGAAPDLRKTAPFDAVADLAQAAEGAAPDLVTAVLMDLSADLAQSGDLLAELSKSGLKVFHAAGRPVPLFGRSAAHIRQDDVHFSGRRSCASGRRHRRHADGEEAGRCNQHVTND